MSRRRLDCLEVVSSEAPDGAQRRLAKFMGEGLNVSFAGRAPGLVRRGDTSPLARTSASSGSLSALVLMTAAGARCWISVLDFFIRHGIITADDEGFIEIVARLHRRLEFPMP